MNKTDLIYQLLINDTPLLDVRAPVEFVQGSFPGAVNIPLLDNQQRHEIGLRYKAQGQDKAIELGVQLVSGKDKSDKLKEWKSFIKQNPNSFLYCFRGGLRSRTTQQWLKEQGVEIPLIPGGYKKMRRFLLTALDQLAESELLIIAGQTGTGKTQFLQNFTCALDLEAKANHRGSSFGHYVSAQPSQIDFENALAIDYLKCDEQGINKFLMEDEGRLIGQRVIPEKLHTAMQKAQLIELIKPLEERINITLNDYIISNFRDFKQVYGEQAQQLFTDYLLNSLYRIRKRLGGKNYQIVLERIKNALSQQFEHHDPGQHAEWIRLLMTEYYDPMYRYQLAKKKDRIIISGNEQTISQWLSDKELM